VKFRDYLFWLPNFITLGRLILVPVLVYFIMIGEVAAAFWVFALAGVSDALDGLLAKRLNSVTRLGTYLDPLADKTLLVAAYVTLGMQDHLPLWLVILVVSRDLMIVGGALLFQLMTHDLSLRPLGISKLNTAAQIILVAVVLGQPGLGISLPAPVMLVLIWGTGLTTALSGAAYLFTWGRMAMRSDSTR